MKIVRSRDNSPDENDSAKAAERIMKGAFDAPHRQVIHRFDGSVAQPTDLHVILESGKVVALPEGMLRGKVAFTFGRKKNKLLLVCAWCGKSMGEVESTMDGISHGMCQDCFDKVVVPEMNQSSDK